MKWELLGLREAGGIPDFSSRDAALKTHYRGHWLKLVYTDSLSGACSFQNYPSSRASVLMFHIHHPCASKLPLFQYPSTPPPRLLLQSSYSDILFHRIEPRLWFRRCCQQSPADPSVRENNPWPSGLPVTSDLVAAQQAQMATPLGVSPTERHTEGRRTLPSPAFCAAFLGRQHG